MKIKTVSRTISFGNYENIGMTAEVRDDEDFVDVVQLLEIMIKQEIEKKGYISNIVSDVNKLKYEKESLQRQVESLEKNKAEIEAWCTKHNLPINALSELPF